MLRSLTRTTAFQNSFLRNIYTSSILKLREIVAEKVDDKTTVIEGRLKKSPREPYLLKLDKNNKQCVLCQLKLNIKHTDVLILCQFIDSKGNMLPESVVGVCSKQYNLISELVYMAQHAGLLPEPPRNEPKRPYQMLNTYYDETTINLYPQKKVYGGRYYYLKLGPIERTRVKPELDIGI